MSKKTKTWKEKLHNNKEKLPEVKTIDKPKMIEKYVEGKMVIPAPLEINELAKQIPEGMIVTSAQMREYFNEEYDAVYTCPMTTGIFSKIVAFAAEEDREAGNDFTPYWRLLKTKGEINEKFPGGIEKQIELLANEGHKITQKGKKFFVKDYETAKFSLNL